MTNDAASAPDVLPRPAEVLAGTPWADLSHGMGAATDVPLNLSRLLDSGRRRRTGALEFLHHVVHHQNTLYEATVPAALYVAGILSDPRALRPVDRSTGRPTIRRGRWRAALLGWLGAVASEANDAAADAFRRHGFRPEDHLPFIRLNRLLPLLLGPVAVHAKDPLLPVREAAVATCIPLVDDARLRHHRTALIPSVRQVLGASARRQHRERAIDTLEEWGEDTTGIVGRDPWAFIDADLPRRTPARPGPSKGRKSPRSEGTCEAQYARRVTGRGGVKRHHADPARLAFGSDRPPTS
ncbi:hypothetical protein AB0I39_38780 [Kitasatospora purpeofusca]|uniref:hypothetical protein n=1 Tax=Kitasatospora purpeofusca TaxID=67352 RepID=UPI0033F751B6